MVEIFLLRRILQQTHFLYLRLLLLVFFLLDPCLLLLLLFLLLLAVGGPPAAAAAVEEGVFDDLPVDPVETGADVRRKIVVETGADPQQLLHRIRLPIAQSLHVHADVLLLLL